MSVAGASKLAVLIWNRKNKKVMKKLYLPEVAKNKSYEFGTKTSASKSF